MSKSIKNRWNRTNIGLCGTKYFNSKSWVFLKNPKSTNGSSDQFCSFGVGRGLLICHKHLPDVMWVFIVVDPASGVVFRPIFDHGVPTRPDLRYYLVRGISDTWSRLFFGYFMLFRYIHMMLRYIFDCFDFLRYKWLYFN